MPVSIKKDEFKPTPVNFSSIKPGEFFVCMATSNNPQALYMKLFDDMDDDDMDNSVEMRESEKEGENTSPKPINKVKRFRNFAPENKVFAVNATVVYRYI